jgi:putative acetyltransferase
MQQDSSRSLQALTSPTHEKLLSESVTLPPVGYASRAPIQAIALIGKGVEMTLCCNVRVREPMTPEYEIAPARWPEDTEQVRTLLTHYGRFLTASPVGAAGMCLIGYEAEVRALPGKYAAKEADLLLARIKGESAGCVAMAQRLLQNNTPAAEIKRLWVEPRFRGFGLGRGLVDAAIAWARSHGCAAVVLDTVYEAMPEAGALYRSLGFEETERFNDNPLSGVRFYILRLDG